MALAEAQVVATIHGAACLVGLFILLLWAMSFAIVGILAKVADVKRRREDEEACLQERLARHWAITQAWPRFPSSQWRMSQS